MPKVTYHDLKYYREDIFYRRLKPAYDELRKTNVAFSGLIAQDHANFYHLLSTALLVDNHPKIQAIKETIYKQYDLDIPIHIFQFQAAWPRSLASNRVFFRGGVEKNELLVLISQHFFNDFSFQEKTVILGHELCHLMLGHLEIPARHILQKQADLGISVDFRVNLLKWSLSAEISSDLFALRACDFKPRILASTLIKAYTGIKVLDSIDLVFMLLNQYDELASSVKTAELTPHPILPLRIKVLDETRHCDIFKRMGEDVSEEDLEQMKTNFNSVIDEQVYKVNPELFDERIKEDHDLFLLAAVAVIVSDGNVSQEALEVLTRLTFASKDPEEYLKEIQQRIASSNYTDVAKELIVEAMEYCKEKNLSGIDVIPVVKFMLQVGVSDGIKLEELKTIYTFAGHYDISKEEIVMLLHQIQ
jgi:hypothetical protein